MVQPAVDDFADAIPVIAQALVPYGRMPSAVEVAGLTDQLLTYGQAAVQAVQSLPADDRATFTNALRDWEYLVAAGPTGTSAGVANWTYTRGLARVVRILVHGLRAGARP